ncbi:MAG: calcineurin-like phosphoesterase family protein [Planctomycetaceae bacterium]
MLRTASVLVALFACVAFGGGLLSVGIGDSSVPPEQTARGIVFHDVNGNEMYDAGDRPLPGVRVSDGRRIVATDGNGEYALPVSDDSILFVIKPRGWRTPLNEDNLPQFFYVHKPKGSPESKFAGVAPTGPLPPSVDFPLTPQTEPEQFQAILFGDTQPRNQQEVDWIGHDVVEELMGTDAAFGVTLGDIVFDDLNVMQPLNRTIALLGIPWYNVIGNHDINQDAKTRRLVNETYERVYGPSYYAFDYGPTHFLVLDNIDWIHNPASGESSYQGGIGPEQLEFIRTDLEQIPEDQMVVLMMHIPLTDTEDRHGLYRLIEQRPFCISISGHTHTHEHVWITHDDGWEGPQPHHHIINVTVCGSWWSGAPDERGIPHTTMADGAPNGYSLLTFDGTDYTLDFRAAGRSPDYQMEIDAPDFVTTADLSQQTISVNYFNGSEKSAVELRVGDGEWRRMTKVDVVDPKFQRTFDREAELLAKKEAWRALPKPKPSTHVWQIGLPDGLTVGTHSLEVRATDYLGREFTGQRIMRVE